MSADAVSEIEPRPLVKPLTATERLNRDLNSYRLYQLFAKTRESAEGIARAKMTATAIRRMMRVNYLRGVYGPERRIRSMSTISVASL